MTIDEYLDAAAFYLKLANTTCGTNLSEKYFQTADKFTRLAELKALANSPKKS